ncbi:MAG: SOS response-associated peptidase [Candidatus Azobacteroides sp.]|nr:SOS response-associated peptidase [Candidatus Azobacteroides sp.]
MCFHTSIFITLDELAIRYGKKNHVHHTGIQIEEKSYHVSAFTDPEYPIITANEEIQIYKWELIPFFIKNRTEAEEIRKRTKNARAETIFEKPSFRTSILRRRCIIPATGYFEYHHLDNKQTEPYFIFLKENEIFSIGGVYDFWQDPDTMEIVKTFSMITTPANEMTNWIHNGGKNPGRMPFILHKQNEKKWLDVNTTKEEIQALLKPFPANEMEAYVINRNFIKKNPQDPTIIHPEIIKNEGKKR